MLKNMFQTIDMLVDVIPHIVLSVDHVGIYDQMDKIPIGKIRDSLLLI